VKICSNKLLNYKGIYPMKNQLVALVAIALGALSISPSAQAGEGGIAAAAAFHIDPSGQVTDIAVGAGIGKTSAVAGAELNYSSVLTSTSSSNSFNSTNTSKSSSSGGGGGCYYYYYPCSSGPSEYSSTGDSSSQFSSSATYKPVTSVKAFAVGSAGSLSYSPGGYYYYYGSGPSIYIGGEDPASVGTAQANRFNLDVTLPGVSYGK
jgi:hypothetical protein